MSFHRACGAPGSEFSHSKVAVFPGVCGEDAIRGGQETIAGEGNVVQLAADKYGRPIPGAFEAVDAQAIDFNAVIAVDEEEDVAVVDADARQFAREAFGAGDGVAGEFLPGLRVEEEDGAVVGKDDAIQAHRDRRFGPRLLSTREFTRDLVAI